MMGGERQRRLELLREKKRVGFYDRLLFLLTSHFFVNVNGYFGMIKGFGGVSSFGIVLELPPFSGLPALPVLYFASPCYPKTFKI